MVGRDAAKHLVIIQLQWTCSYLQLVVATAHIDEKKSSFFAANVFSEQIIHAENFSAGYLLTTTLKEGIWMLCGIL